MPSGHGQLDIRGAVLMPICVTVTKGVQCGHQVSDHDSGGCCRAMRCECSHLTEMPDFDPLFPAVSHIEADK